MVKHRFPTGLIAREKVTNATQPKKIIAALATIKKQGFDYLTIKSVTPQMEVWDLPGGVGDTFIIFSGHGKKRRRIMSGTITKIMPYIEKQLRRK